MTSIYGRSNLQTEIREFFKLAIPLVSAQVAQSATGFADTIMMGRLGADVLAAGGLSSITFLSLMATGAGMVMGTSPLVAEAFGAGKRSRIEQLASQSLWMAVFVSIPLMLLTADADAWMRRMGQPDLTVQLTNSYLDIMVWGLFPAIGFAALRSTVSALSQARPIMVIVVAGTGLNIAGNYVLGFGKFGFPRLEMAGLAIASVLSLWGMFLALAFYILQQRSLQEYRIFQTLHHFNPRILKELAWVGIPIGLFTGLETGFFMVITLMMGRLGTTALAAHQVVFQTIVVAFMVPLGISFATTVRVGQALGRGDRRGIQQAVWVSMVVTSLCMVVLSIGFLLFPRQIIGIYLDVTDPNNAAVVAIAMPLLFVAAIAQVLDGFQKAVYGALQGLQDTQIPMLLNILGYWGVGISLGYWLGFHLEMGGVGLWIGQSVAIVTVAGLFTWRFFHLLRRKTV